MGRIEQIRNIGIIAHIDAGKTTLSERMLFYSKTIHRMGEVHDGTATMDYLPEERERGITIVSACASCQWRGLTINLVDTPGHVDFTIEVERSLRVLDGAIGVFCAVGGVEPQSETVWRQSEHFAIPKIAFINKMDRVGANFQAVLDEIRTTLNANPLPLTIPLGEGKDFTGIVDLVRWKKMVFDPADQGRSIFQTDLENTEQKLAQKWRDFLLEHVADADDTFLEHWLAGQWTENDFLQALRRATLQRKIVPVLCGSALHNTGVQPLLDAICDLLPSPLDMPPTTIPDQTGQSVTVIPDPQGFALCFVFKVRVENGHKLALMRIYSGTIKVGTVLHNTVRKIDERVGQIFRLRADNRDNLEVALAGDIVAVTGLRSARTGETYTSQGQNFILEPIDTYEPVITLALEAQNSVESKTLEEALKRYADEDPTLRLGQDEATGERMISGMGELHLEVLLERMRREYGITPRAGEPQVVLRETLSGQAECEACFDRELGKERHQGKVTLRVEALARHSNNLVTVDNKEELLESITTGMLESILAGINDALQSGVQSGWPVTDVQVSVVRAVREEATSLIGCRMATVQALKDAFLLAGVALLEPIMNVEISVPDNFLGGVVTLFTASQGKILAVEDLPTRKIVQGTAPMRRMFGFAGALRSATQGRAGLTMRFDRYDLP